MDHAEPAMPAQPIRFSTGAIAKRDRFDFFMAALQHSLWQVTGWSGLPDEFFVELQGSTLGCLTAVAERICAHRSHRTRGDVERSAERSYHLFVGTGAPWSFTHRGRHERLEPGDVVLIGEGEHETHAPQGFEGLVVKCPEHWIQTWMPEPELVTGRRIRSDSTWGRVLSPTLRQLGPAFTAAPPLPAGVIVDHIGAVLALIAGDADARERPELLARIRDCIRQRCAEPGLTAGDVALSLSLPARVVHQALAAAKTAFATELLQARLDRAMQLLRQRGGARCSLSDLARQAGFSRSAQLEQALRRRLAVADAARYRQALERIAARSQDPGTASF
jgi:AraC family transcriptional regulator, positive regulator of tynA and feaB